ncbi:MAG TPA: hypothetical protein GXX15_04845 [Clostridia bacterium]|nr:hypothetical protein [Clostridia bacterium]
MYFSIRLVLGQKLLKDEKGFFIKADPDRLVSSLKWSKILPEQDGKSYTLLQKEKSRTL